MKTKGGLENVKGLDFSSHVVIDVHFYFYLAAILE